MSKNDASPGESTVELIGGLVTDAKDLAIAHLDGIRLEVKEELRDLRASTKYAAAAAAVFAVAGLLAAFTLAQAVWTYTPLASWASYGLTTVVFVGTGVGLLALRARRSDDIDLVPETGLLRLRRDARWMARKTRDAVA